MGGVLRPHPVLHRDFHAPPAHLLLPDPVPVVVHRPDATAPDAGAWQDARDSQRETGYQGGASREAEVGTFGEGREGRRLHVHELRCRRRRRRREVPEVRRGFRGVTPSAIDHFRPPPGRRFIRSLSIESPANAPSRNLKWHSQTYGPTGWDPGPPS